MTPISTSPLRPRRRRADAVGARVNTTSAQSAQVVFARALSEDGILGGPCVCSWPLPFLASLAMALLLAGCTGTDLNARPVTAPEADQASLDLARRMDAIEAQLREGDVAGAQAGLDEALAAGVAHPRAYYLHGLLLKRRAGSDKKLLDQAAAAFQQAVATSPRWPEPRIELADTWIELGHLQSADDAYAQLAELFPWAGFGPYGRARVAWVRDRRDEALTHLGEAMRRNPDYPPAILLRARFAAAAGDVALQEQLLHRYLSLMPGEAGAHVELGSLAEQAGRLEDARRHWELAYHLRRDPAVARRLADLARRRGDAATAAQWDARR